MEFIFLILILLFSIVIHEVAHGLVAYQLGDPTAKYAGRLTLNPIKHLDPIGSVLVPLFLIIISQVSGGGGIIFGWAKPVPVNPYNFRDKKYGDLKVALAGPGSNIVIALFFGLALRFIPGLMASNLGLMFSYIVYLNILLAVFNLMPVPPLDGSHILFSLLPYSARPVKIFLYQFGFIILLFIIFFFFPILLTIIRSIFYLITGANLF